MANKRQIQTFFRYMKKQSQIHLILKQQNKIQNTFSTITYTGCLLDYTIHPYYDLPSFPNRFTLHLSLGTKDRVKELTFHLPFETFFESPNHLLWGESTTTNELVFST